VALHLHWHHIISGTLFIGLYLCSLFFQTLEIFVPSSQTIKTVFVPSSQTNLLLLMRCQLYHIIKNSTLESSLWNFQNGLTIIAWMFFFFIIRIHGLSNHTTWLNDPFWPLNISILTRSSSVKWHVYFLIKPFDQDELFNQVSNWTSSQNVLKNEYPNQNDIWFSQKWQGLPILLRYPMGFVGQNGTWPCQYR
jgi:preprotein translocase subunit Sec63